ncbi:MAG: helix-turn-helix transcriptional regulator [Spirochaetaceae bacterium]|jgi:DNA-binding CsgD family transcriptional regulator|nr:helix-turn-helix transcriptional regulator [Spirochaetaceae bacterium]
MSIPVPVVLDIIAIGVYMFIVWMIFCKMSPELTRRRTVITLICVPLWYCIWVAAWYSGNIWLLVPGRVGGWICVGLIAAKRPGISYKEGLKWTMLSVVSLEWMNEIFDASLGIYLWIFPVFNWIDTNTFSLRYCLWRLIIAVFCLGWSFFYRRIIRGLEKTPPVKILVLLWASAIFSSWLLYSFTTKVVLPPRPSADILFIVGTVGMLLCAAFMCLFYFYINSLKKKEAMSFTLEVANKLPIWHPENGISQAFIDKYELTKREIEVTNLVLLGRVDKEIAVDLGMKLPTVHQHLQNIYAKTDARGRYALMSMIYGWTISTLQSQ